MASTTKTSVENALRCVRGATESILRQYVRVKVTRELANDPFAYQTAWQKACAETPRPLQFAETLDSLHAASELLTNAVDEMARDERQAWEAELAGEEASR